MCLGGEAMGVEMGRMTVMHWEAKVVVWCPQCEACGDDVQ